MIIRSTKELSQERVSVLLAGESGLGKTSSIKTVEGSRLIMSMESGLSCLAGTDIDTIVIDPNHPFKRPDKHEIDPKNPMYTITEVFLKLVTPEFKKKYDVLFIDSLTELSQLILADLKKDPTIAASKNGYELWGKYKERMMIIIKMFRDLSPYTVIFTCLTDKEKDGLDYVDVLNIEGASVRSSIKAMFDVCIKYEIMEIEDKKHRTFITDTELNPIAKDRTGKLNKYEKPDLGAILRKIKGDI